MQQCWFLSFLWKRREEIAGTWHPVEATSLDEHPMDYVKRARQANPRNDFCLMFFQPIPIDVYRRATEPEPE
jgi:hypothetical protein